jgi:hypothetical protein
VFRVADAQGVSPLVGRNLRRCQAGAGLPVPGPVMDGFRAASHKIADLKARASAAMEEILAFLADQGLEAMPLTAAQADHLLYPDPALTFGRDLDLVIRAEAGRLSSAQRARIAAYFTACSRPFAGFVAALGCGHEFFEYDFFTHHDLTLNGTLAFDFDRVWRDSIAQRSPQGHTYRLMVPEDLLISLCISSFRKRYFRLKNLVDVAECVNVLAVHPDATWRLDWDRAVARAHSFDAQNIVYAALLCARQHLQAAVPATVLRDLESSALGVGVIRWLVQRRSFCSLSDFSSLYDTVPLAPQPMLADGLAPQPPSQAWRPSPSAIPYRPKRDLTLLLPLASYRPAQFVRKLRYFAHSRRVHAEE